MRFVSASLPYVAVSRGYDQLRENNNFATSIPFSEANMPNCLTMLILTLSVIFYFSDTK